MAESSENWYPGDLVIDANDLVARRAESGDGWLIMGFTDDEWPDETLAEPIRRLVPATIPVKGSGTKIYRITKVGGDVRVGPAQRLAGMLGVARQGMYASIRRIERVVIPEDGWTDITADYAGDRGVKHGG